MARWYCAPPKSRMCALGSCSLTITGLLSGPTKAPPWQKAGSKAGEVRLVCPAIRHQVFAGAADAARPYPPSTLQAALPRNPLCTAPPLDTLLRTRMCSSAMVSPKRSGGAATVPRSSSCSFCRKASRKMRPFSCAMGGMQQRLVRKLWAAGMAHEACSLRPASRHAPLRSAGRQPAPRPRLELLWVHVVQLSLCLLQAPAGVAVLLLQHGDWEGRWTWGQRSRSKRAERDTTCRTRLQGRGGSLPRCCRSQPSLHAGRRSWPHQARR